MSDNKLSRRKMFDLVQAQLENERTSFLTHWQELSDYIAPRRARIKDWDTNRGDKRNQNIIDSTATMSLRTLRSGMMSGVTSPARPWFKLTLSDPELSEFGKVRQWLDTVTSRMNTVFLRSNLYNVLPIIYGDMGLFGTGAMAIEEDLNGNVFNFVPFQIGSYSVAQGPNLKVDTFNRKFRMTARQMVEKFGITDANNPNKIDWSVFSQGVKDAYDKGQFEQWFDVTHFIRPNELYKPNNPFAKYKKYTSCYYEHSTSNNNQTDLFLRESGYDYFPILCPRWEINGEDVYGTSCPGMEALGDVKQLQVGEKRSLQAVDKMINPPLTAPTAMRNSKVTLMPGDINYVDVREGVQGIRSVYDINFRINELEQKQAQCRGRIQRAFFEDLFLMLASSDRRQITAREIDERHEEKLLALGPVLEQLNQDLLDPLIDTCFRILQKQRLLPPPPPEIAGADMKIEYISIMAQAQKMVGIGAVERFSGFVAQVANINPEVLDKVNADSLVDVYSDLTSVPSKILRTEDEVKGIRGQRAQAQAQQAQQQTMMAGAKVAKDLSGAVLSDDNALAAMIKGGAVPSGL